MKYLKSFEVFETSLTHGFSGGSGAPAFGLGGVNYGYDNIPPTIDKGDTSFLFSELTGEFYDNDEVKELVAKYLQLCRERQCEPVISQIEDLTPATFDEILSSLK
jgi:hypothetical protein